jgi:YVTN family beta-propeller protein
LKAPEAAGFDLSSSPERPWFPFPEDIPENIKENDRMFRNDARINLVCLLVGLLAAAALSAPALAQSVPFPTYSPGENTNATTGPTYSHPLPNPWVVSNGAIITPVGTQVYLGVTTRAKAIALNPTGNHTAAVLQMGAPQSVTIFNTVSGTVLQNYKPFGTKNGAANGIAYTPDGMHLLFSQDNSWVAIANVSMTGMLSDDVHVSVPMDANAQGILSNVTCFPNSPGGTTGSFLIPCGNTVSRVSDGTSTSYPLGIAISSDGKTAYVVLDNNDTLTKIDLTAATPKEGAEVRVGNVPHSVIISPNGQTAYVSNEAGRIAKETDFQGYSNGTPVVAAFPTGATATGTVSVVDLASFTVTGSIETGLHPTGMALWGQYLLVANAYSDNISVIDTTSNQEVRKIDLGLPIGAPGGPAAYGAGPNSIAVDSTNNIAYIALYNANAIAVVELNNAGGNPVLGMIPVGYAPSSVVLDTTDGVLLVANDKGIGSTGFAVAPPPMNSAENSYQTSHGVTDFGTHQDLGTVSIIPVPASSALVTLTNQVFENNHWDLAENIYSAAGGNKRARPVAIPERIGDPSLIKHVFVIIRENRTYDQILGDVVGGNGDPSLAIFGDNATYGSVTPNVHALVQRFPLLDNFYDPSRQSADGHNWITQAMAPYSDDIQSPDWLRDYPSNGGDALAYQKKGHLWDQAANAGVSLKNYGEYIEYNGFNPPQGCTPQDLTLANTWDGSVPPKPEAFPVSDSCEPLWIDFYNDVLAYESGAEKQLYNYNTVSSYSPLPNLMDNTVQNYPQFDLGIPDQFRFDIWNQDFQKDVTDGTVPQLEFIWVMSDHTGGPPTVQAEQADNDLAIGRFIDAISHSSVWSSSAIFIEEDDAQDGVDHVDGHRSPGYVISPYVYQRVNRDGTGAGVLEDGTFYTQVNMTRTIEQILGLPPMNQFDLVASPMTTLFTDNPPPDYFKPWTHVANGIPLNQGVTQTATQPIPAVKAQTIATQSTKVAQSTATESRTVKALRAAWLKEKAELFAGKYHIPDSEDPDIVSHYDWYEATGFKVPFPGEKKVRFPRDFKERKAVADKDKDDDGM